MIKIEENERPVVTALKLISNKWKVHIIFQLLQGKKRFGELHRSIGGISQKVLTDNLRAMESDGLLTRKVFPEVPPHVEYSMSELGHDMVRTMNCLVKWGEHYQELVKSGKIKQS
jgi:DNA-binding HxlR family transcriptional regulator